MLQLKKDAAVWVPVRILDTSGNPVPGLAFGDMTCTVLKSDGTEETTAIDVLKWFEATTGALTDSGNYRIKLPTTAVNTVGFLTYVVKDDAAPPHYFVGLADVVAFLEPAPTPYVSFTSNGDTIAPIILQVAAPTHTQVRVTFSEAVVMTAAANGALNLSNYSIPSLTISAAVAQTAQQVMLTTSAQTPNILYTLTVTGVEDLQGNPIA